MSKYRGVFATDLDGVLLDLRFRDFFRKRYNVPDDLYLTEKHWGFEESYGLTKEQADEIWQDIWSSEHYLFGGALEFVKWLNQNGFGVHIISSRPTDDAKKSAWDDVSTSFLIDYTDVHLVNSPKEKIEVLQNLKASYMLEDNLLSSIMFAPHVQKRVFLMNAPYNQSHDLGNHYVRVLGFEDIKMKLKLFEGGL